MEDLQLTEKSPKTHHYLVSAKVLIQDKENGNLTHMDLNCTIFTKFNFVTAKDIGNAQRTIQYLLFQRIPPEAVDVHDVHINSISYLGHMRQEEFLAGTEHTKAQNPIAEMKDTVRGLMADGGKEGVSTFDPFADKTPGSITQ